MQSSSMHDEVLTVRRTNWRAFSFFITIPVSAGCIVFLWLLSGSRLAGAFIPMFVVIAFFQMRIWGLLTKVRIGPEAIEISTPLKKYVYHWKQIARTGMYEEGRGLRLLQPNEFLRPSIFGWKYIWFSTHPQVEPVQWHGPDGVYGDFEFDRTAWKLFERYAMQHAAEEQHANATSGQPPQGFNTFVL